MILDSSVLLAVLFDEPERDELLAKADSAARVGVGAPTLVESAISIGRRWGLDGERDVGRIVEQLGAVVVSFERQHWTVAADAFARFGKGRHPARLNFGDCLTYATARVAGEPLLCKGDDFAKTDLQLA